eukprot:15334292-Heterocapsa_arctica.AAC.1
MRFALPVPFPPIPVDDFFAVVRPRLWDCPVRYIDSDLQLLRGEDVWLWCLEFCDLLDSWVPFERDLHRS